MSLLRKSITLPTPSGYMVWEEFVASTGIDPDRLRELLALGWLDTGRNATEQPLFRDVDIYRVRKLERRVRDLRGLED